MVMQRRLENRLKVASGHTLVLGRAADGQQRTRKAAPPPLFLRRTAASIGGREIARNAGGLKRETPAAFQTTGVFLMYRKSAERSMIGAIIICERQRRNIHGV
jgi:hypothetical protein